MKSTFPLVLAALVLAACASEETSTTGSKGWVEREYRTGSNIATHRAPANDGVETMSKDDVDRVRNSSLNPGVAIPPPRPGGSH